MMKSLALAALLIVAPMLAQANGETERLKFERRSYKDDTYYTGMGTWRKYVIGPYTVMHANNESMEWRVAKELCSRVLFGVSGWKMPSRSDVAKLAAITKEIRGYRWSTWIDAPQETYNGHFSQFQTGIDPHGEGDILCVKHEVVPEKKKEPEVAKQMSRPHPEAPVLTRVESDAERMARQPKPKPNPQAIAAERERAQKAAREEAAIQVAKLEAETKKRKECMRPEAQGMCGCTRFQAPPPGGWKVCGK